MCGQLHAALGRELPVGCATPVQDDFDRCYPRAKWQDADTLLFVTDNRFDVDVGALVPTHVEGRRRLVTVLRGGRTARVFVVHVLTRRAEG
jgi:hypothetical protein